MSGGGGDLPVSLILTINEVRVQPVSLICPLKGFIGG